MRRKDREVTDTAALLEIIGNCKVCRIGMVDEGQPYIVPLNFGYEYTNGELCLYFHGAHEGKKIDILKKNPSVCFEMDGEHALLEGESAAEYSFAYASVIGFGTAEFVERDDEKIHGLNLLMRHQTGQDKDFEYPEAALRGVEVYRVKAASFTGKQHKK